MNFNYKKNIRTQMSRLIIALLNSGNEFTNMKEIQSELSKVVQDIIPNGCKNFPCPFMTDGDELGGSKII